MRITQIKTLKDAGLWLGDQALHGLIGWLPVVAFAQRLSHQATAAAVILTIREGEQARDNVQAWLRRRRERTTAKPTVLDLLRDLHLPDRIGDIAAGTLAACGLWTLGRVLWRLVL